MYERELEAIKKAHRFRERELYPEELIDLASNDYLGYAEDHALFQSACRRVGACRSFAPKASQLVNGYHPIHREFEAYLCSINDFPAGIVAGSGFLANLSLIEALPRKKDLLLLDERYHASGILASRLVDAKVAFFRHNDAEDLKRLIQSHHTGRVIVAVEGIYSMEGDLCPPEIFETADRYGALLIVDEAHSSGVVGERLLGVFDYYGIRPKPTHIKMGTLGKAMGSYGAYILASEEIILYLQNRAKALIYATAPSVFDIALGDEAVKKTQRERDTLKEAIKERQALAEEIFGIRIPGLILRIEVGDSQKVMTLKEFAKKRGVLIGAIRPPTVERAILRIILRTSVPIEETEAFLRALKERM
ncbi:MAG: 8-amino-7-oxononanoate synthase [Campylobacteraceae bacterium 4484_4]|nr:MAG: 8-amino-7-oxononanoate synthase [Campylobacteraceae bacterium 4484_4]